MKKYLHTFSSSGLITLLFCAGLSCLFTRPAIAQDRDWVDLRDWSVRDSPQSLSGVAQFFESKLLSPTECREQTGSLVPFPELWQNQPPLDYGTYHFMVLLPQQRDSVMMLSLPQVYSAYAIFVNDKLVARNGTVGTSRETTVPQWLPQAVAIHTSDTLDIVLQIANFHHAKGGIKDVIRLGSRDAVQWQQSVMTMSNLGETIALTLAGLLFLWFFIRRRKEGALFYFSMLCLTWAVRSVFSNNYLFIRFDPDFDWNVMVRIEYITIYLATAFAILIIGNIFRQETTLFIKYGLVLANFVFLIFTLFFEPRIFTEGLNIYLITSGLLLFYIGFVVIKAWANERTGSGLLTISIILGINIFAYDIIVYEGFSTYNPVIFSVGYVLIFSLIGWALALHVNLIRSTRTVTTQLRYEDLYKDDK